MPNEIPRMLGLAILCAAATVQAQEDFATPRTSYGVPDLQGIWRNATVTPLTRDPALGNRQAYTPEEAYAMERSAQLEVEEDNKPLDPDRPAPVAEALPPVMYNSHYQIVQSPGYVTIVVEMVHDARIIRIADAHADIAAAAQEN